MGTSPGGAWIGQHDVALEADVGSARRLLAAWSAPSLEQAATRDQMLDFIDQHADRAHLRTCVPGHLTASAILLDSSRTRVLLTLHRKLGRWLQLGGHCDGDANLRGVALRECYEESGLESLEVSPLPIDVDIHSIPARPGEPEHLHLDTRFVVRVPSGASDDFAISVESEDLRWFTRGEAHRLDTDASLKRLIDAVLLAP